MKKLLFLVLTMLLTACVTAQVKYDVIIEKAAPMLYLNGTGSQIKFYGGITVTQSTGKLLLAGGNFDLGANNLLGTGSLGATGAGKLTKIWSVDAEFSNVPTINGVPMSTTYATIASPSFTTGITTPAITLGTTLLSVTGNQLNYLNTATSDIQTQLNAKEASLGNPSVTGYVLSSTTAGVRSWVVQSAGSGGSVSSVGVTTANGVSAVVTNPTGAADMTFSLGAITPTSVNTVVLSGSSTPTLAVTGTSSISGVNTGNNAVNTLYSGLVSNATHTGQVTGSTALTIATGTVTLANMANVATATVFYRKTTGTGVPQVQTLATLKTDLGLTGTNSGDQTTITGNAGTATVLQTARTINGISFNGSANIIVPSDIAPGTAGNVMQSTGTAWASNTPTDLATVAMLKHPVMNAQTGASYTLALTDDAALVTMNYGTACTLTIPTNTAVAFPYGTTSYTVINIANLGAGTLTINGAGTTLISKGSLLSLAQGAGASLIKVAINTWWVVGGLQ
jgi:hypothetical protein